MVGEGFMWCASCHVIKGVDLLWVSGDLLWVGSDITGRSLAMPFCKPHSVRVI